jgi:hypothetical protein
MDLKFRPLASLASFPLGPTFSEFFFYLTYIFFLNKLILKICWHLVPVCEARHPRPPPFALRLSLK